MILAARHARVVRAAGDDRRQTLPFRDKELMKGVVDAAGMRTPGRERDDGAGVLGGRGEGRLPADHQADRRRRIPDTYRVNDDES